MDTLYISVENETLIRMLLLGFLGFLISMIITPLYTALAYRGQWWKQPGEVPASSEKAAIFKELHIEKHKRHIPTMAGGIAVVAVCLVTVLFNLTRAETWLPVAAFAGAATIGLLNDIISLKSSRSAEEKYRLSARLKVLLSALVAIIGGWFFYYKLDVSSINVPLIGGQLELGWLIIPLFVLVVVASANAVSISDGLDGLAGGLTTSAFTVYAVIASLQGNFGIAGFCLTIVGALLSYTWFNIYPARFFMGNIGSFALGTALGVVAMLTDTVLILPIIGAVFFAEAGSSILQMASKRFRGGKKIFKVAPVHHHLEATGWPETKVTMRFWVLGQVAAVLGLIIFLMGDAF